MGNTAGLPVHGRGLGILLLVSNAGIGGSGGPVRLGFLADVGLCALCARRLYAEPAFALTQRPNEGAMLAVVRITRVAHGEPHKRLPVTAASIGVARDGAPLV
jgi:hypothetical protein